MLFKSMLLALSFLFITMVPSKEIKKTYHKEYYETGVLKAQGWKDGDIKTDYWFFYWPNGLLEKEGHFKMGKKADWWIFYDDRGVVVHKCQLSEGKKNGYCLMYMDEELTSAQKYANGKKIKEWYNLRSFKKENKLSDLK